MKRAWHFHFGCPLPRVITFIDGVHEWKCDCCRHNRLTLLRDYGRGKRLINHRSWDEVRS